MYISTPPSPEVENFQMKIYYPAGDRTPDLLNQRQTCYRLSQRGAFQSSFALRIIFTERIFVVVCPVEREAAPTGLDQVWPTHDQPRATWDVHNFDRAILLYPTPSMIFRKDQICDYAYFK